MYFLRMLRVYDAWFIPMFSDDLFHPDHIVPFAKLESTFMEMTNKFITHFFVESDTVIGQILILFFRISDA